MIDIKALKKVLELMCDLTVKPKDDSRVITHGVWFDGDTIVATDGGACAQLRIDDPSISHFSPKLVHAAHVRAACTWLAKHRASDLRAVIAYDEHYVQLKIVSRIDTYTPVATYHLECAGGDAVENVANVASWRRMPRPAATFHEEGLSSFGVSPTYLKLVGALFLAIDAKIVFRPADHPLSPIQCENRHVSRQGGAEGVISLIVNVAPVRM